MKPTDFVARAKKAGLEPTYVEWYVPGLSDHGGGPVENVAQSEARYPNALSVFLLAQGTNGNLADLATDPDVWLVDLFTPPAPGDRAQTPKNLHDAGEQFDLLDQ